MIAGLNFNIQMMYLSKKGSDSNDFPCNVLKLTKRKNADQAFFFCIDSY